MVFGRKKFVSIFFVYFIANNGITAIMVFCENHIFYNIFVGCPKGAARVPQGCPKGAPRVPQGCPKVTQGHPRVTQGHLLEPQGHQKAPRRAQFCIFLASLGILLWPSLHFIDIAGLIFIDVANVTRCFHDYQTYDFIFQLLKRATVSNTPVGPWEPS